MIEVLFRDEHGAVSVDWVTLTAGILLLTAVIVYTLMNDSAGHLMDEFEILNARYEADAESVSALGSPLAPNAGANAPLADTAVRARAGAVKGSQIKTGE